jgi:hypothetical protein
MKFDSLERRLEWVVDRTPRGETEEEKLQRARLSRYTNEELAELTYIITMAERRGTSLTEEEAKKLNAILESVEARPLVITEIDPDQPVCHICKNQPAFERDGSWPLCDRCYTALVGHGDEVLASLPHDRFGNRLACAPYTGDRDEL